MLLYHGSKNGILGAIAPVSRKECDFGQGFYMGTDKRQPLTLICDRESAMLYTLELDLSGLKVLEFETDLDWALTIAYCRGVIDDMRETCLYTKYKNLAETNYDLIIGKIANDRIFFSLDQFFRDFITDVVLIKCLSELNLGLQYVAKTEKACSHIKIISKEPILEEKRSKLKIKSKQMRKEGVQTVDEIRRKYFREGKLFSEIIGRTFV